MEDLTILKKESLGILRQLELGCEQFQFANEKDGEITIDDIELTPLLKKTGKIGLIEQFLKKEGLNFSVTPNLIKRPFKFSNGAIIDDKITGVIKGGNIQIIKTRIKDLIGELTQKTTRQTIEEKENTLITNKKRTTLPRFPRTEWFKVSIKFIDERNFLLSNSIETKPCIPESLGCLDNRNQKPDGAWEFLLRVANGNGMTNPIEKKEREKQKKHKQRVTDILRNIFENDTDPFEKEKGGVYKAKFSIGFIEDDCAKIKEKGEYLDLEEVYKEMTEE